MYNNLCQASAARVLRGWRFTVYSLATCLKYRVFSEQSHRTTHKTTLSVASASFFVPAAPRRMFYHASDKAFRALGLSVSTAVGATVVFVLGRAFLKAISEPFVARNAAYNFFVPLYFVFLRSEICAEHATFVFILSYIRQNAFQYYL